MNRREALGAMAAAAAAMGQRTTPARADAAPARTALGLVVYCCRLRRDHLRRVDPRDDLNRPSRFLQHCRQLGAGGMQIGLGVLEADAAGALRRDAETAGLYIEAMVNLPGEAKDVERFDAAMRTAKAAGARAARATIMPGRRYEYFESLRRFREVDARGRRALELAAPIAEKHRLPLAIENHKDHRNQERVALLGHISSEYVGACVDTGNSFALLEDPIETVRRLAPWARSVHLKDQAVQWYEDGFLLADVPLGRGILDLKSMLAILRQKQPDLRFSLELITRDPLRVPCLTEKYWATFPDVPGSDLARTLRQVRAAAADSLPYVSGLSAAQQLAREDANVRESLDYARQQLGLLATKAS
ncbi:MAG: sugar phosphate isomerase/epimerase [Pirellulales bacterium]|nr:sugar phosphate isomerase/epimerase [Pirellulales bacterium]